MAANKGGLQIKIAPTANLVSDVNSILREVSGNSARAAMTAGALVVASEWRNAIYRYPLVETGTYGRSVGFEIVQRDGTNIIAVIGTDIVDPPYPFFLEYGTSRMTAKVHVRPAMDRAMPLAERQMGMVLDNMIARYGS